MLAHHHTSAESASLLKFAEVCQSLPEQTMASGLPCKNVEWGSKVSVDWGVAIQ